MFVALEFSSSFSMRAKFIQENRVDTTESIYDFSWLVNDAYQAPAINLKRSEGK